MDKSLVSLTTASGPYQESLIGETLKSAGIPYTTINKPGPGTAIQVLQLGATPAFLATEFQVPPERLQEAKDLLCSNGIVCEVSERLLNRALEEIVAPLLDDPERDLQRLVRFVDINNRETVKALIQAALRRDGGRRLVEDLFFAVARAGTAHLRVLARVLQTGTDASFGDRFQSEATLGEKPTRLALLEVLNELPQSRERARALAAALRDRDGEIREAASEALYSLGGEDYGYDPEDPPGEREAAVQKMLAAAGLA